MIIKYKKVQDEYTTYTLRKPDSKYTDPRCTELCTIGEDTYINVPDGVKLPEQPKQITLITITLTDELRAEIKAVSPHVRLINARVVEKIRGKYPINDEFKMLRTKDEEYLVYVDKCTTWGTIEKNKIGL